jgi:hypothetical protein
MSIDVAPAPAPDVSRPRLSRGVGAAGLCATVAVAGLVGFGWWDTHPNVVASAVATITVPTTVGQEYTADTGLVTSRGHDQATISDPPGGGTDVTDTGNVRGVRVTIQSVHANIVSNTAAATVTIELCRRGGNPQVAIGTQVGADLSQFCTTVGPVQHQSAVLMPASAQLVAFITPHRPGTVHIAGFRLSYREGIRRQTQTGGVDLRMIAH